LHKEKEMLDLRKLFLAIGMLALLSVSAFAQNAPLSCVAQAAGTPSLRAEGVAELTGDVVVICSGGVPYAYNAQLPQVNIQVFSTPSINITSRILAGGSGPGVNAFSEALLFIDDPTPAEQTICGSTAYPYSTPVGSAQAIISGVCAGHPGSGNGVGTYKPSATGGPGIDPLFSAKLTQRGNAYQARQTTANSLIWQGVPFDPPGTQNTRVLRIVNVRVNASQLGVPAGSTANVGLTISTSASGVGNPIALPITNPSPIVGIAQNSLTFSVVDGVKNCLQCENANSKFLDDNAKGFGPDGDGVLKGKCDGAMRTLRYQELFPSVFRRRSQNDPGTNASVPADPTVASDTLGLPFQSETGVYKTATNGSRWEATVQNSSKVTGTSSGSLGLADHGTRLIARFNNVQNGIQVWVEVNPTVISISGNVLDSSIQTGRAVLTSSDPNGAGPFSAITSTVTGVGWTAAQVSIVGGTGQAVWEITNADTTSVERVNVRTFVAWKANTTNNLPSLGTNNVNGNLAPLSTVSGASSSAPLPRFVDTATNKAWLAINSCRTNLLFPFVTNQAGFDTGLAISNTSKDPFGTAIQTGACTVNFYGKVGSSNVCLSFPSPSITGGEHFVWSLSSGGAVTATAGFQGYVIAQCNFQYGHGYAFISDLGVQKIAQGYLALVLDAGLPSSRTGSTSESLGH
jgi:hypothetical protein